MIPDGEKPDDLEREIEDAIESIGTVSAEPPSSDGIIISERPASYIPDSMFEAVSDSSEPSLTEKEASSPSVNERRRIIIEALQTKLGIKHWPRIDKVDIRILVAAEAVFVHDELIENEDMLRKVLLLVLFSMNPKNYSPSDESVMKRKRDVLQRALISEFKKRGKHDLAAKLEKNRTHLSGQFKAIKT